MEKLETFTVNKLHKREVCRYWLESRCQKGPECPFLHAIAEKMPECAHGSRCNRKDNLDDPCLFAHTAKQSRCANQDAGFCSFGNRCPHEHVFVEGPPPELSPQFQPLQERQVKSTYKKAPCAYFRVHGWCPYFEMCNFLHVKDT